RPRAFDDVEHLRLALVHRRGRVDASNAILEVRVVRREPDDWLDEVRLVRLPFALGFRDHGRYVGRSGEQPGRQRRVLASWLLCERRRGEQREDRAEHTYAHETPPVSADCTSLR